MEHSSNYKIDDAFHSRDFHVVKSIIDRPII